MADDTVSAATSVAVLPAALSLLRPRQWVKNGFVLAPLLFAAAFDERAAVLDALLATVLFCIASSATYVVNDLQDRERDRQHPVKRLSRPLASGAIGVRGALLVLALLYAALGVGAWLAPATLGVIAVYLLLNLLYTFVLKHQPVLDIFTVALGFVLRVWAGAVAIDVPLSSWMFITTLCLALFMAAVKRRQELAQSGTAGRGVLERYSLGLVDRYAEMAGTGALVFYSLFVMSSRPELVMTVPLVLFGLFRYWYVVDVFEGGESPTDVLLGDRQLQVVIVAWVAVCAWALWPRG